jgi:hypothetical protein
MAQTIQILRTNTNVAPTTLLPGALSAELGPQTKLWIGSGSGNRLLLSSDPADSGAAGGAYLKLAGGTLTGALTLAADPSLALGAATKQYTDAKDALRLLLTGGTLTGPLTLAADPAAALQPATKQYVDAINTTLAAADTAIRSTYLPLAGGTLTGALTLAADPAAPLQAATRQYVDAKPSGATILATAPASPVAGQLWWDSTGGQLYVYYNDGTSQQWVTASSVPGNTASTNNIGRNLLHNPLFNIQQRGAGPFTATGYTADRWAAAISGSTMSVSTAALPAGSLPGLDGVTNYYANGFTGGSGAGDYVIAYQHIEGVQRTSGLTVTLSFWANASPGGSKLGVTYSQNFGTGGSTAVGPVSLGTVTLSSTLTRYTLTAAIPSVAGKTIGTGGLNSFQISFWYSAGSNYAAATGIGVQSGTISLAGVQLEVGSVATPLEKPDPRYDLANCQRFYQSYINMTASTYGPGAMYNDFILPVCMRAAPTAAFANVSYGNASGVTAFIPAPSHLRVSANSPAAGPNYVLFDLTLSADL